MPSAGTGHLQATFSELQTQVNSASYPQRDGKWADGKKASCGWLRRWYVFQLHHASNCSPMDGRIMRCGVISSCQSAATSFWDWKAHLVTSLTHVSSHITVASHLQLKFTERTEKQKDRKNRDALISN